jgi:CheY-like chemotaxis protein
VPDQPPVVLIAERDHKVRELQDYFLGKAGFRVDFADDGVVALERAQEIRPAVVVTEILLPKLDGLALCRQLRAEPATRETPIIVFSILAAAGRAQEAGATLYLRKPFVDSIFVPAVMELAAARPLAVLERS